MSRSSDYQLYFVSASPEFESRLVDLLSCLQVTIFFLCRSRKIAG
jgi:hypothetical protein